MTPSKPKSSASNKFCDLADLGNEASVEQFFCNRLLADLGYDDRQIKPKTSLQHIAVSLARKKVNYKPDYALEVGRRPRWVMDAKAVNEKVTEYIGQCASYCLQLNQAYKDDNPVQYFLLTNGATTELYRWDRNESLLTLDFTDFVDGNPKYEKLLLLLGPAAFRKARKVTGINPDLLILRRGNLAEINAAFGWCHKFIYKRENLNYSAAFMEFVKLVFLKLISDKGVHRDVQAVASDDEISIPRDRVRFSTAWIEAREADHPNPVDALQFQHLVSDFEEKIRAGTKKRIFALGEHVDLSPETIKGVVGRLEELDLYGIDADLNGRLFETFLNATLRGKDLGQFFTPRTVVKLATRLARVNVSRDHVDLVLDACCGTGGFLIEALGDMWAKADANLSLTDIERAELKELIAAGRIYGVDVAKEPPLARIARINMYLHGDGGSSIFQVDALDKAMAVQAAEPSDIKAEKRELKRLVGEHGFADIVLTNPPFAKEYTRNQASEKSLLDAYDLAFDTRSGARRPLPKLKSSVMFIERYYDLLKPGGTMVTIVDDSILGGRSYKRVRDYIRRRFIVRAVVSLPGDAFQRSQARVKTSILILQKKTSDDEQQPPAFMYYCTKVGVDDPARQRELPADEGNRQDALREVEAVADAYDAFLRGEKDSDAWTVDASGLSDRMDVKACLIRPGRHIPVWKAAGLDVRVMGELLDVVYDHDADEAADVDDLLVTGDADELVTHLRVRYDGFAEPGEEIFAADSGYANLYRVRTGDLVISHINAVHGAVAVIPEALDGCVVTTEYTVCRPSNGTDVRLLWALLRTREARAELLTKSTGIGRSRISWVDVASLSLPLPSPDEAASIVAAVQAAEEREVEAQKLRVEATADLDERFGLDNQEARDLLAAFKPPR